jgi:ABC-type Na+ efflux pump permease subunit
MRPAWWVICSRELRDLWIGGKALHLILIYTVLLGIYAFLLASNAEVKLLPLKEMVLEMVRASIMVALFISLLIGADSVSGERERATLEGLLLTPASRRQIVFGKLLAAVSPWPVALAVSIPYWSVLAKGDPVFSQALLWGVVLGTLLAPACAALGMIVSMLCNSNKSSMLVSIGLYLLLLLPTELARPGRNPTAAEVRRAVAYQWVNPWDAASTLLGKTLMNDAPLRDVWVLLVLPVLFTVIVLGLVFLYGNRGVRLEAAAPQRWQLFWARWGHVPGLTTRHD